MDQGEGEIGAAIGEGAIGDEQLLDENGNEKLNTKVGGSGYSSASESALPAAAKGKKKRNRRRRKKKNSGGPPTAGAGVSCDFESEHGHVDEKQEGVDLDVSADAAGADASVGGGAEAAGTPDMKARIGLVIETAIDICNKLAPESSEHELKGTSPSEEFLHPADSRQSLEHELKVNKQESAAAVEDGDSIQGIEEIRPLPLDSEKLHSAPQSLVRLDEFEKKEQEQVKHSQSEQVMPAMEKVEPQPQSPAAELKTKKRDGEEEEDGESVPGLEEMLGFGSEEYQGLPRSALRLDQFDFDGIGQVEEEPKPEQEIKKADMKNTSTETEILLLSFNEAQKKELGLTDEDIANNNTLVQKYWEVVHEKDDSEEELVLSYCDDDDEEEEGHDGERECLKALENSLLEENNNLTPQTQATAEEGNDKKNEEGSQVSHAQDQIQDSLDAHSSTTDLLPEETAAQNFQGLGSPPRTHGRNVALESLEELERKRADAKKEATLIVDDVIDEALARIELLHGGLEMQDGQNAQNGNLNAQEGQNGNLEAQDAEEGNLGGQGAQEGNLGAQDAQEGTLDAQDGIEDADTACECEYTPSAPNLIDIPESPKESDIILDTNANAEVSEPAEDDDHHDTDEIYADDKKFSPFYESDASASGIELEERESKEDILAFTGPQSTGGASHTLIDFRDSPEFRAKQRQTQTEDEDELPEWPAEWHEPLESNLNLAAAHPGQDKTLEQLVGPRNLSLHIDWSSSSMDGDGAEGGESGGPVQLSGKRQGKSKSKGSSGGGCFAWLRRRSLSRSQKPPQCD